MKQCLSLKPQGLLPKEELCFVEGESGAGETPKWHLEEMQGAHLI